MRRNAKLLLQCFPLSRVSTGRKSQVSFPHPRELSGRLSERVLSYGGECPFGALRRQRRGGSRPVVVHVVLPRRSSVQKGNGHVGDGKVQQIVVSDRSHSLVEEDDPAREKRVSLQSSEDERPNNSEVANNRDDDYGEEDERVNCPEREDAGLVRDTFRRGRPGFRVETEVSDSVLGPEQES